MAIGRVAVSDSTAVRHAAGWSVVTVDGALDIYTAPRLRELLIELMTAGHNRLVIDMDAVTFIDSTGLGVLVGALKRVRQTEDGALRVVATHDPVLHLMRMTRLDRAFGPYDTVAEAVGDTSQS